MKKIIYFLALCITIVITSCSKEEKVFKEENLISNETTNHFILKETFPPIQHFDCDATTDEDDPVPTECNNCCPDAGCPMMGYDCANEVVIHGIQCPIEDYNNSAEVLDDYIAKFSTAEFFSDEDNLKHIENLMPELLTEEAEDILDDLKQGTSTIDKWVYWDKVNKYNIYFYRIFEPK